jgi:hypothetical protein
MELLAPIRPDAIITDISPLIQDISIVPIVPFWCVKLGKCTMKESDDNHRSDKKSNPTTIVYKAEKMYCVCKGWFSFTLYGPKPTYNYSLRELVRNRKPLLHYWKMTIRSDAIGYNESTMLPKIGIQPKAMAW